MQVNVFFVVVVTISLLKVQLKILFQINLAGNLVIILGVLRETKLTILNRFLHDLDMERW
jgi:hypothetical protein